jgi:hypothetical protein
MFSGVLNRSSLNTGIEEVYQKSYSFASDVIDRGKTFVCRHARAMAIGAVHTCCLLAMAASTHAGIQTAGFSNLENQPWLGRISAFVKPSYVLGGAIFGIGAILSRRYLSRIQIEDKIIKRASKNLENHVCSANRSNCEEATVVIFPEKDPTLAYYNEMEMKRIKQDLSYIADQDLKRLIVPIWACGSHDLAKKIQAQKDKIVSICSVIIYAHGCKNYIELGDAEAYPYSTVSANQLISNLYTLGFKKGSVIFISCSTGKKGGITEKVAQAFPEALVYGPSVDFSEYRLYENSRDSLPAIQYFEHENYENLTNIFSGNTCREPSAEELEDFKERVYSICPFDLKLANFASSLIACNESYTKRRK